MKARAPLAAVRLRGAGTPVCRVGRGRRIDGVDVEVLVAALILREQDVLAVARSRSSSVIGRFGSVVTSFAAVNGSARPFTQTLRVPFVRLEEGEELAVGGELGARDLGVAEEELPIEQRRELTGGGGGAERQRERQQADCETCHGGLQKRTRPRSSAGPRF